MLNFRNKIIKQMMAFALTFAMIVSSVTSSGMTVFASETPQSTEAGYTNADTADSIKNEEDVGIEENETLEQDGAAEIENEDTVGSSDTGTGTEGGSKADASENKSETSTDEESSSAEPDKEEHSSAIQSSEEHSSAIQSSEEQSSAIQSSSEPENPAEPKKIDVWDFGVKQETGKNYRNNVTSAGLSGILTPDSEDASKILFPEGKPLVFGDLQMKYEKGDRIYADPSVKDIVGSDGKNITFSALHNNYKKDYGDGYTAAGGWYGGGARTSAKGYALINVQAGDKIIVYGGNHNKTGEVTFTFELDGNAAVQSESTKPLANATFTKAVFVAKQSGTYKIYQSVGTGKPMFNRIVRMPAVDVSGTIDLGPLESLEGATLKFVNETTKAETDAVIDGTNFTVKLAAGYTYNAVLTGKAGYGPTNGSKELVLRDEDALNGKSGVTIIIEEKQLYDYSGTIKGFAADYPRKSDLKVIMKTDPDVPNDDVKLNLTGLDTAAPSFTAKLEPDIKYTITLEGVNDYQVKGNATVKGNQALTADIEVELKPTYEAKGNFIDLDGNAVTAVTELKFKNVDDEYEYPAVITEGKSYTASLRDGVYSAVATVEGYQTTGHVIVEGKAVNKDILFVSTAAEGDLTRKADLYVGYADKGDANYETVNKAVKAAKRMKPASEADRITIHIAPGVYREQVIVDVPYISFVNDTPDKEVRLTWYQGIGYLYYSTVTNGFYNAQDAHDQYKKAQPKNWGATVQLKATGFLAENITFEHSLNRYLTDEELEDGVEPDPDAQFIKPVRDYNLDVKSKEATERGAAFYFENGGDKAEFYRCKFLSSQDTLGTCKKGENAYFKECFIEGNTDYICGDGDVVFDNCVLNFYGYSDKEQGGYITAAKDSAANGYLFWNCTVTGNSDTKMKVGAGDFGRNWGAKAKVTFVNTKLERAGLILDRGWTDMSGPAKDANFAEYNTTSLDGKPVDTSKRVEGTVRTTNPIADVEAFEKYFGGWTPKHYVREDSTVAFAKNPEIISNSDINHPLPGNTLTVKYSLGEANDANDASIIKWYRLKDGVEPELVKASTAQAGKTYKIQKTDVGFLLKVEVTPTVASGNAGTPVSFQTEFPVSEGWEEPGEGDAELGDGINIFLAGDSTVKDYSAKGMYNGGNAQDLGSWGEYIQKYFNEEKVTIVNYANGGRSLRNFMNEGTLDKIKDKIGEGDYLFIQFGHNDSSASHPDRFVPIGEPDADGIYPTTAATVTNKDGKYDYNCGGTFKWFLKEYIKAAKDAGATPILVTPVSRMYYTAEGKIRPHHDCKVDAAQTPDNTYTSSNDAYVEAYRQVAKEEDVLLLDAFALTKKMYEDAYTAAGDKKDAYGKQIMGEKEGNPGGDATHCNKLGGMMEAAIIAAAIQDMGLNISSAVKAPAQVGGTTTGGKSVFSVDGKGKLTAYDILTDYAEKAAYWEDLGQKMFDAIGAKAEELKPAQMPEASPANGATVTRGQKITLSAETGAEIHYTTDKTAPTKDSTRYDVQTGIVVSDAIIKDNAVTIKAIAIAGGKTSGIATFTYTVEAGGNTGDDDDNSNDDDKIKADENEDVILLSDTSKITVTAADVFAVNKKVSYKISVTYKNKKGEEQELKENVHYNVRFVKGSDGMTPGPQKFYIEQVEDKDKKPVKTDLGTFKGQSAIKEYTLLNKKGADKNYDISKMVKKLEFSSAVYTGTYITPGIEWKTEPAKDKNGKNQYTVVYRNNVNAGKASVTVLGQGEYYGSKTLTFTIKAAKLADIAAKHTVEDPAFKATGVTFGTATKGSIPATTAQNTPFTYKGKPITFNGFAITYKNADCTTNLKKGIDYTIDYKKNAQEGTATATIKGMNNYTGSVKVTYAIENIDVSDLTKATVVAERALQGSGVATIEFKEAGVTLKAGVDFKPDNKPLKDVTEIGKLEQPVSVPIKGLGSYKKAFAKGTTVPVTEITSGHFYIKLKAGAAVDKAKLDKATDLKKKLSVAKITDVNGKTISDKNGVVAEIADTPIGLTVKAVKDSDFVDTQISCHVANKLSSVAKQDKTAIVKEFDGVNTVTLGKEEIVSHIGDKKGQNVGTLVTVNQIKIVSYKNNHKTGNATVVIEAKEDSPFYGTMNIKFKINADRKTPTYGTDGEGSDTPSSGEGPDTPGSSEGPETPGSSEVPDTPGSSEGPETPGSSEGPDTPPTGDTSTKATIWVVGDSTVCGFTDNYYIPRQGYGEQIGTYFNADVYNYALSGRSSKSFTAENNYKQLINGGHASMPKLGDAATEGKFLIIGFGHNDEKIEDSARYTAPNGDFKTEGSFAKSLYDNYIKPALDAGVTPVVATPIVRYDSNGSYTGAKVHEANGGDYAQAIRDLCEEEELKGKVILADLTAATCKLYKEDLGNENAEKLHAFTTYKYTDPEKTQKVPAGRDDTHINSYGAKMVAWLLGEQTKDTALNKHWRNKEKPSEAVDYAAAIKTDFEPKPYEAPTEDQMKNTIWDAFTDASGRQWYGTAFGNLGGTSKINATNFVATVDNEAHSVSLDVPNGHGKISGTTDAFFFYYTRLPKDTLFELSAKAEIERFASGDNQNSYGLMVRDDLYINKDTAKDLSLEPIGDYISVGTYKKGTVNCFGRKSGDLFDGPAATTQYVTAGDVANLKVVKDSEGVTMKYGENETISGGFDYPLMQNDTDYIYVGFYVTRNAKVKFSDISLTIKE